MSHKTMYRYQVSVDGSAHAVHLTSDPVDVGGDDYVVEFWAEHTEGAPEVERSFKAFGTGQPVPTSASYVGTAPRTLLGLVWHLYELTEEA